MPPAKTFPIHDRALGGRLADLLRRWRSDGLTLEQIRERLDADHGIPVSEATVRRWLRDEVANGTEGA